MSNSSIWPIERTRLGAITLGQSGPGSNGTEGVLQISQSSKIGVSQPDCFVSYLGHSLGVILLLSRDAVEYSKASVDLACSYQVFEMNFRDVSFKAPIAKILPKIFFLLIQLILS